ncbi:unnamed protein product [Leptosia nina]|uniref:Uncharacterized protein n=1 Tax=Leptosia nina TaxID=320188 RepID=A0AAV1JX95_9NEOP
MAAPMREGAPAGGARPAPTTHTNFEYDDNEWDIGIGDLIIDLDADIEKTDEAGGMAARAEPDAQRTALKMKIKRTKPGTKSSEAKHEIVKSNEMNGEPKTPSAAAAPPAVKRTGGHRRDKARDKHHHPHPPHDVNGVARVPPPPNAPGPPAQAQPPHATPHAPPQAPKPEPRPAAPRVEPKPAVAPAAPVPVPPPPPAPAPAPVASPAKPESDDSRQEPPSSQPPAKKQKTDNKMVTTMFYEYRKLDRFGYEGEVYVYVNISSVKMEGSRRPLLFLREGRTSPKFLSLINVGSPKNF